MVARTPSPPGFLDAPSETLRLLLKCTLTAVMLAWLVLCALLFIRRMTGDVYQPLEPAALIALAVVAATIASSQRLLWRSMMGGAAFGSESARLVLPGLALLLLMNAVSVPESSPWALGAAWLLIALEECSWCVAPGLFARRGGSRTPPPAPAATRTMRAESAVVNVAEDENGEEEEFPAGVLQQMVRKRDSHGVECVSGWTRGRFAAGERTLNLHIAFCPPLEGRPHVDVHQVAGPLASVKLGQIESFGIRFEVRLSAAARPFRDAPANNIAVDDVVIAFDACCPSSEG